MAVKTEVNTRKLTAFANRLGRTFPTEIAKGLFQAAEFVAGALREEINAFTSASNGPKSGALSRSFRPTVLVKGDKLRVGVYSSLPYARIQDQGGTIVPVNAKALAVPLTNTARRLTPRQMPGLVLIKTKGKALLVLPTKKGKITPQYVLKQSVTLRGHFYIEKAEKRSVPVVKAIMIGAARRAAVDANRGG